MSAEVDLAQAIGTAEIGDLPTCSGRCGPHEPDRECLLHGDAADQQRESCPLCPGRFSLATFVCDTCGYDPHGYYRDDDMPLVYVTGGMVTISKVEGR